jgi:hypothetical protein
MHETLKRPKKKPWITFIIWHGINTFCRMKSGPYKIEEYEQRLEDSNQSAYPMLHEMNEGGIQGFLWPLIVLKGNYPYNLTIHTAIDLFIRTVDLYYRLMINELFYDVGCHKKTHEMRTRDETSKVCHLKLHIKIIGCKE